MATLARIAKSKAKQTAHALFALGQRAGIDILPNHFYSATPDLRELRQSEGWKQPRSMSGVAGADVDLQLAFAQDCVCDSIRTTMLRENIYRSACTDNALIGFGEIEAEFLFCFTARHQPRQIIQVGAGISTAVLLHVARTFKYCPRITCIDPYPNRFLRKAASNGQITLIADKCQNVDLGLFSTLGAGDLLFVDSTHTVKPGSEVNLLILEVLPRLASGCYVHFHDIYFPYDYACDLLTTVYFWNETSLLHAFLVNNNRYSIAVSLSMVHHARPEQLQALFPQYQPEVLDQGLRIESSSPHHFPASTYLRVGT